MIYVTLLLLISRQVTFGLFLHVPLTLFLLDEVAHFSLNHVWQFCFVFYVLLS